MVEKTYVGILVDRVCRVTGGFRVGWGCVDQIFTLKQIVKKQEKTCRVYVSFIELEKVYHKVNMEALWQVLRMYDVGSKLLVELRIYMLIV